MDEKQKSITDVQKTALFEQLPIPRAVMTLAVPTVISSLVMVIYNLADTYFVGMINDPVQNAAVTLAAPVLLAFNAVNNLFGVGSSSMMSRALGQKDYDTVYRSSAFGFYCSLICGVFCAACVYFFILLFIKRGTTYVCINPRMFGFTKAIVFGVCAVGIPASIQNLLNVTGMTVLNNFTSSFGSDAVAATGDHPAESFLPALRPGLCSASR